MLSVKSVTESRIFFRRCFEGAGAEAKNLAYQGSEQRGRGNPRAITALRNRLSGLSTPEMVGLGIHDHS